MNRKEKIFAYIKSKEYVPLRKDELKIVLDVPDEDMSEFLSILDELCSEGRIYITKKGRYVAADSKTSVMAGKLRCAVKGRFGFVTCDDESEDDIFVDGDMLGHALSGDRVLVKIDDAKARAGHIINVLERGNKTFVGIAYRKSNGSLYLRPDDKRIYADIKIDPENSMEATEGVRIAAEFIEYKDNEFYGQVVSVLGEAQSIKSCVEGIIIESGVSFEFDDDVLGIAQSISDKIDPKDIKGRKDLRDQLIFTIDGDDARDFDDAVSLDILQNGNYYLGVHIADVSHYVKPSSFIDNEAYKRGTSIYLADRVIPMLPEKLSNGICSLNPKEDRLTLSVFMEIDGEGDVLRHETVKSVICSKERMTYNNVTKLLENSDESLYERYEYMMPTLENMCELSKILTNRRKKRGAINFDFPETSVMVDENGEPIDIIKDERGISNRMIEEFMLCANETVAEYAYWAELPFIYRVHEQPSTDKIMAFNDFIRNFGLVIKGGKDGDIHPKALQQVLDAVKDTPEERMVASNMLRSLMKAEYKTENTGHFGLAAKYYCHFTSPIRRYPDLVVHRMLKSIIDGREPYKYDFSSEAAHSSECEIVAERMERDVDELMKTAYMSRFIGKSFDATVANVTKFGMFVGLDNSIEGLVRVENIMDDYYEYDEISSTLTGKRHGMVYRTGTTVRVTLANTDILARQIDFVLEKDMNRNMMKKFEDKPSKMRSLHAGKVKKSNINRRKFLKKKKR